VDGIYFQIGDPEEGSLLGSTRVNPKFILTVVDDDWVIMDTSTDQILYSAAEFTEEWTVVDESAEPAPVVTERFVDGEVENDLPEAFEEDEEFAEGDDAEGDMSESYDEEAEARAREEAEAERRRAELQQAKDEEDHLLQINRERQRTILMFWERDNQNKKGRNQAEDKLANSQTQNQDQVRIQYHKTLDKLNILWDELDQKREEAEEKIDRLTSKLDRQDEKATELSDSFKAFKREIAREARHSRTGKQIRFKRILAFEASEEQKDREVAEVRLKHINLLNQLKQLEDQVKEKEELAEGLHLIDFEQLKIENQTLNEKIEERNDELHKLRKKTTTTVQVLTHIKEKLKFVMEENKVLEKELSELDVNVTELRDKLTRSKKARDQLRAENATLKQKQGFIGSDMLVGDFEGRKVVLSKLQEEVDELKSKHARLTAYCHKAERARNSMGYR
jgi:hypothetical protein